MYHGLVDLFCACPSWLVSVSWLLIGAGILTALIAAVPGFIDYLYTVPPKSSGHRRATLHMVINLTAVALFAVAWFLRAHPEIRPEPIIVAVETAGALLIGYGGMLGGKLVVKNMIGVDSKFAAGGRWSEITVDASGAVVASKDELLVDQMKLVRLHGKRIVVARAEGTCRRGSPFTGVHATLRPIHQHQRRSVDGGLVAARCMKDPGTHSTVTLTPQNSWDVFDIPIDSSTIRPLGVTPPFASRA